MTNVALVVLDTLRQDAFDRAFDWLPGRRFPNAYATAHWTVPAHASLFTGKYASEVGVHGKAPNLDCPERTLAEAFRADGYRTRCFTANPQMVIYDGWERGFDEFVGYESLPAYDEDYFDWGACFADLEGSGYERHLRAVLECLRADCATIPSLRQGYDLFTRHDVDGGAADALDRIRATDFGDEEFCFVNLMEAHTPYYPPDDGEPLLVLAAEALAGEDVDLDRVERAYAASVDYLAEQYREIFAELAADFDYVITCSDHGELLGEHGLLNHSYGLYPELVDVPVVVSGPGVTDDLRGSNGTDGLATAGSERTVDGERTRGGERAISGERAVDDRVVSLLDVHRTAAELAGVDVHSRGQDLLGEREPTDVGFEYHGLLSFHAAQFDRVGLGDAEYERRDVPLDGVVTPDGDLVYETHTDGLQVRGDLADPAERLEAFVDGLDRRSIEGATANGSDAVRDRLEALGYA